MTKPKTPTEDVAPTEGDAETHPGVCGIVMPISPIEPDYTAEHWRRVQRILERAVRVSRLKPQLVWENPEVDVIQSRILQNLYENDVVICDVSGHNPNVMLELGMRLSTKRPTIIVGDKERKSPFDINVIDHLFYQKDLEFNAIDAFIEKLAKKILTVYEAQKENRYKSFVENFQFEMVTPATVQVSAEEVLTETVGKLSLAIARVERMVSNNIALKKDVKISKLLNISAYLPGMYLDRASEEIKAIFGVRLIKADRVDENGARISIQISGSSEDQVEDAIAIVRAIIDRHEGDALPF